MAIEIVKCDGKDIELSPMRAGQLRDLHAKRLANPERNFIDDNIFVVASCLVNADKEAGRPLYAPEQYMEKVEALSCPSYNKVLDVANIISGFVVEKKKLGEDIATEQK
jgi:hypothetical protein